MCLGVCSLPKDKVIGSWSLFSTAVLALKLLRFCIDCLDYV